jgi:hypothetical protein
LNFLIVYSGRMEARCAETKDAAHYIEELERFRRRHHHLRGVYLIYDGDPSHPPAGHESTSGRVTDGGVLGSHRPMRPGSTRQKFSTTPLATTT